MRFQRAELFNRLSFFLLLSLEGGLSRTSILLTALSGVFLFAAVSSRRSLPVTNLILIQFALQFLLVFLRLPSQLICRPLVLSLLLELDQLPRNLFDGFQVGFARLNRLVKKSHLKLA